MLNSSKFLSRSLVLLGVCLLSQSAEATYGSGKTSTYVFVAEQSQVVQTGGIAGVPRTYSIQGQFELTVDPNVGSASFAHVDANATKDSSTLDLNHVFNMMSLVGTVEPTGSIKFTGNASDGSDVGITVTVQDDLAHLVGQTTPPPNSADFFIFNLDAVAQRKYGGGSGTAEDPYQIATAEDLIALGETPEDYDKHFILVDDIDLGGHVFDKAVITPATAMKFGYRRTPFDGLLDGNGHMISHLTVEGDSYLGLIGELASGADVKNLSLVDVSITGSGFAVGGLVGWNYGTVTRCYSTGAVSGSRGGGGLVGTNYHGNITLCYSNCVVDGNEYVGGLLGSSDLAGDVTDCYSTGSVSGRLRVGGLVGENGNTVTRCLSTGTVSGEEEVGGLVGYNIGVAGTVTNCYSTGKVSGVAKVGGLTGGNSGRLFCCYSTGAVSGHSSVGGLLGWSYSDKVTGSFGSFWDTQTSGQAESNGGTGKMTAEMKTASTFLEAGWDFVNIWGIGENQTYPYLRKYSAVDINQDASVNFLDLAALAENWLTDISHR
jgi:hypothetical protein